MNLHITNTAASSLLEAQTSHQPGVNAAALSQLTVVHDLDAVDHCHCVCGALSPASTARCFKILI